MEENQTNEENKQKVEYRVIKEGETDDPDGYLASFPVGYRFLPTDEELIIHYLKPKNLDQLLPISCIKTFNPNHQYTPEELTEEFKLEREQRGYFFAKLISGWRTYGHVKPIYSDGQLVGYNTSKVFYRDNLRSTWRMQEYRVQKESDTSSTANAKDDWILCEIYNKVPDMPNKEEKNLQQEDGKMSTRVPDGEPNTGPKIQNDEDLLQLCLGPPSGLHSLPPDGVPNTVPKMQNEDPPRPCIGHHSSGLQSSGSEVSVCDEYFDSLPPGYRFCPTDEELIVHFVKPKNLGQPLPINRIPIANNSSGHPQSLTETHKPLRENEWYLFTTRSLRDESRKIENRTAANGFWTDSGAEMKIYSNGELVGCKKRHIFSQMKSEHRMVSTNWRMVEYKEMKESGWRLCNIHNSQEHKVGSKRRRIGKGTATADAEEEPNKEQDKAPFIRFL